LGVRESKDEDKITNKHASTSRPICITLGP